MRVWISCLLILSVMLATLSTAPSLIYQHIIPTQSLLLTDTFLLGLSVFIFVLFVAQRLLQYSLSNQQQNNATYQTLSPTPKRQLLLQLAIFLLILFTMGLHTIATVQREIQAEITQPIRVLAKVRPIGLSDSNYYPSADMGYRQLAVIEAVQPLTLQHFQTNIALEYINSGNNRISNVDKARYAQLAQLQGKQVLLSARFQGLPKKSNLPIGFSTDFSALNQLQPNQSTYMMLALSPIADEDEGFIHRWLRARHVNAQARVLAYQQSFVKVIDNDWQANRQTNWQTKINQWRWQVRKHFLQGINGRKWEQLPNNQQQAQAVTLSLLTGDRALINKETKNLYQLAGISHLLAISGTHVLFLAVILTALVIGLLNRYCPMVYQRIARSQMRWLVMIAGATIYALFTGFDVPSARTVYMLVGVGLARWLLLEISARQVLLIIAVFMAVLDPYVLWQAGFWLSFVAVMLLISYELSINNRRMQSQDTLINQPHSGFASFVRHPVFVVLLPFIQLQLWIFLALLPLSLLLFGKVSLWGVLVNLFAIGLYGWLIVPLNLLAGLFYVVVPSVADFFWRLLGSFLTGFHEFLAWLVGVNEANGVNQAWLYTTVNAGMILIMILLVLPMLAPRNSISKLWSIPPLVLLLLLLMNQNNYHTVDSDSDTLIYLLDNKFNGQATGNISSLLISSGDEHWLVLAEHHKFKPNKSKLNNPQYNKQKLKNNILTNTDKQLAQSLIENLAKLGVSSLTGVIVQTPSLSLIQTSEILKRTIPVRYLWQAGNKQLNPNNHSVLACDSSRHWQSDDGQLSIEAMTGWQEIDNPKVWDCAIRIHAKEPILINPQYPIYWSGGVAGDINRTNTDIPLANPVVINASVQDKTLWQLWQLLCVADKLAPINNNKQGQSLLITHSYEPMPKELMSEMKLDNLLLLDKATADNHQRLDELVLEWEE